MDDQVKKIAPSARRQHRIHAVRGSSCSRYSPTANRRVFIDRLVYCGDYSFVSRLYQVGRELLSN